MTMKLGVVMDPIKDITFVKDTTLGLLLAASARDYSLYYMQQSDLYLDDGQPKALVQALSVHDNPEHWFDLGEKETIDLDQLAEAITPAARLKDSLLAFAPRCPNTGFCHPLAQGLLADGNLMKLEQLLTSQGRTKIVITLSHQVEDGIAKLVTVTPIAGTATLAGDKTLDAVAVVSL